MGTRERRERDKEALKLRILNVAKELFAEDGYKSVTIRRIAEKVEYSLPTIYEHFESKAEILLQIYYQSGQMLLEKLQVVYAQKNSATEKLEALGRAYISFGLENREYYELTFLTNSVRAEREIACKVSEPGLMGCDAPSFEAFKLLGEVVKEAQAEGHYQGKDPLLVSQIFWAGIHGLVSLIITNPEFPWITKDILIDSMLKTLINGIK